MGFAPEPYDHLNSDSLIEVLILGHLSIEEWLTRLIELRLPHPEQIKLRGEMNFNSKLRLCGALGLTDDLTVRFCVNLNKLRNKVAHNFKIAIDEPFVEPLIDAFPKLLSNTMLEGNDLGSLSVLERLRRPILMVEILLHQQHDAIVEHDRLIAKLQARLDAATENYRQVKESYEAGTHRAE